MILVVIVNYRTSGLVTDCLGSLEAEVAASRDACRRDRQRLGG